MTRQASVPSESLEQIRAYCDTCCEGRKPVGTGTKIQCQHQLCVAVCIPLELPLRDEHRAQRMNLVHFARVSFVHCIAKSHPVGLDLSSGTAGKTEPEFPSYCRHALAFPAACPTSNSCHAHRYPSPCILKATKAGQRNREKHNSPNEGCLLWLFFPLKLSFLLHLLPQPPVSELMHSPLLNIVNICESAMFGWFKKKC